MNGTDDDSRGIVRPMDDVTRQPNSTGITQIAMRVFVGLSVVLILFFGLSQYNPLFNRTHPRSYHRAIATRAMVRIYAN